MKMRVGERDSSEEQRVAVRRGREKRERKRK